MKLMAKIPLTGFVMGALALSVAACSPFGGATVFTCETDTQCGAGGKCEPDRLCSFENATCPGGRAYGPSSGPQSNLCVGDALGDGGLDAPSPEAGDLCYGAAAGLVRPCFMTAPSGTRLLNTPIDTDPGSPACATNVSNTTACVIAAESIEITGDVPVSGARPLVLVATTLIEVGGNLDASSDRTATVPPLGQHYATLRIGPASNPAACQPGSPPVQAAGGAGGSFGTEGGTGGAGPLGGAGGGAGPVQAATLRGGCDGQPGDNGTPGRAGHGGGAVYLIAPTLTISGSINASGEGGDPGITNAAGGGGGGSGGLIGLDAATITNSGVVFANGGGGAEGSGSLTRGDPGDDPSGVAAAAGGAGLTSRGGDGGSGAAQGTPAAAGSAGISAMGTAGGGGGGGGGAGIIQVFGGGTLSGAVSPDPS